MELAEVFITTGELDDALNALNQQLDAQPDDQYARRLRADVLLRLASPENLKLALADINQLDEKSFDDYVQASIIYERLQDLDSAISAMQSALKLVPHNERILERLIEILVNQQQYNEALQHLLNAPQTWRWFMRQADVYVLLAKPNEALDALNHAEEHLKVIFPDLLAPVSRNTMAQIHIARAHLHMTLLDYSVAEAEFKHALYHIPDDTSIRFNLGLVYALTERLDMAIKHCQKALNNTNDYLRQSFIAALAEDSRFAELKSKLEI